MTPKQERDAFAGDWGELDSFAAAHTLERYHPMTDQNALTREDLENIGGITKRKWDDYIDAYGDPIEIMMQIMADEEVQPATRLAAADKLAARRYPVAQRFEMEATVNHEVGALQAIGGGTIRMAAKLLADEREKARLAGGGQSVEVIELSKDDYEAT